MSYFVTSQSSNGGHQHKMNWVAHCQMKNTTYSLILIYKSNFICVKKPKGNLQLKLLKCHLDHKYKLSSRILSHSLLIVEMGKSLTAHIDGSENPAYLLGTVSCSKKRRNLT